MTDASGRALVAVFDADPCVSKVLSLVKGTRSGLEQLQQSADGVAMSSGHLAMLKQLFKLKDAEIAAGLEDSVVNRVSTKYV